MTTPQPARAYNQDHVARKYTPGKRRFSIYWTWSYPWEANRDLTELDNRFSTMTEVRRVAWPGFEKPEWDKMNFLQGIAGTLELFHRSTLAFQKIVGEATGHPVSVFQRIDQAGYKLPIDERILDDTDTLMVFGLDHLVSEQEAAPEEVEAIRRWLDREGTCLLLAPHHDVGLTDDLKQRQMEYRHHGDELVPRQQRFGQYTRPLIKVLGAPGALLAQRGEDAGSGVGARRPIHSHRVLLPRRHVSVVARPPIYPGREAPERRAIRGDEARRSAVDRRNVLTRTTTRGATK